MNMFFNHNVLVEIQQHCSAIFARLKLVKVFSRGELKSSMVLRKSQTTYLAWARLAKVGAKGCQTMVFGKNRYINF